MTSGNHDFYCFKVFLARSTAFNKRQIFALQKPIALLQFIRHQSQLVVFQSDLSKLLECLLLVCLVHVKFGLHLDTVALRPQVVIVYLLDLFDVAFRCLLQFVQ